jgi:hypothetical protein
MSLSSRTTFLLLLTNGFLSGSGEQVGHYNYISGASDFVYGFSPVRQFSCLDYISKVQNRCDVFGWHSMGEISISS